MQNQQLEEILTLLKEQGHHPVLLQIDGKKGGSGYIDFIKPQDLNSPVAYGQDDFGRPFVCLHVQIQEEKEATTKVFTFFQRYQDRPRVEIAGDTFEDLLNFKPTQEEGERIRRLCQSQTLESIRPGREGVTLHLQNALPVHV
jgi:hypothetical protein